MKFIPTPLSGAFLIEMERLYDERGYFAQSWCRHEFANRGLNTQIAQCNISVSKLKGTVRGMHFQRPPHSESKLVRCSHGAIYDVIVDLRHNSPTRLEWFSAELSEQNGRMMYVPEGLAHGFQTLVDDCQVIFQNSEPYRADAATGVRWNDPALGIDWPLPVTVIAERDTGFPDIGTN